MFNPSMKGGGPGPAAKNVTPTPVWMFLNSWDVGDFKVGLSAQKSPWGGSNAMEVSNVFGHRGDKLGGQDISAITSSGFTKMTTSIATWVGNDLGYIQFALVTPAFTTSGNPLGASTDVGLSFGKLVRVVATLDVGGWDTLVGFGIVTGSAGKGPTTGNLANARVPMNLQFIDGQIQGEVGDMSVGVYADWAHAKGKTSTATTNNGNLYGGNVEAFNGVANTSGSKFDAFSARVEVEPIDRVILGIGYGYRKLTVPANELTSKVFHLAATYKLYQNMDLNIVYNSEKTNDPALAITGNTLTSFTTRTTVIEVEALM